jgi:hypothetical protein
MSKNPHAAALGRLGGKARLKKLTPERRRQIARAAGLASGRVRREKAGNVPNPNATSGEQRRVKENEASSNKHDMSSENHALNPGRLAQGVSAAREPGRRNRGSSWYPPAEKEGNGGLIQ